MNFWQKFDKPIIGLSPMDGVTDASFRFITAKHGGPDVTFTEFVNVESVFFSPHVLIRDLMYTELERPVVAQIYGHTPELFYKVAHIVCELGFDGLDINMGCPARKVAANGSGAALILKPRLAQSIIQAVRQGIQHWSEGQTLWDLRINPDLIQKIRSSNRRRSGLEMHPCRRLIPLSVKTRLGYDQVAVEEWIQTLLEEKPSVISIHGRTLQQMYKGNADWEAIARAVSMAKNSGTLILGNGDLQNMKDVYRRVRETDVDGVLLGRSVLGNPWIFRTKHQVKQAQHLNDAEYIHDTAISLAERLQVIIEHCTLFENQWSASSFVGMRKHLAWYCKAIYRASELRSQMVRVSSVAEVVKCLRNYATTYASQLDASESPVPELRQKACTPDLQL
ncbi:MAG: tRNA dihydrouridine synthase [Candidatus Binatia bacterium]